MKVFSQFVLIAGLLTAAPAVADTYTIDNNHTSLTFDIGHFSISRVAGRFNTISGTFDLSEQGALSNINVVIDVNTVDTKVEARDNHLRTADFFNVATYPQITFVSDSIKRTRANIYAVTGKLTLMGVTKDITATVTHNGSFTDARNGSVRQGATVAFTLNRSEYGMTGFLETISDDVNVVFNTEGIKN